MTSMPFVPPYCFRCGRNHHDSTAGCPHVGSATFGPQQDGRIKPVPPAVEFGAELATLRERLAAAEARIPAWLAEEQAWKETEARLLADLADTRRRLDASERTRQRAIAEIEELIRACDADDSDDGAMTIPSLINIGLYLVANGPANEESTAWAERMLAAIGYEAAADAAREGGDDNGK